MSRHLRHLHNVFCSPSGRIYLAGWGGIALEILLAHLLLGCHSVGQVSYTILLAATDAAFVMIPFWILPRRLRWTMALPLLILPVFLLANIWNYRFTGNLLAGTGLLQIGNVNTLVLDSVGILISPVDLLFPAISILAFIPYIRLRKRANSDHQSPLFRLVATILALLLWSIPQFVVMASYQHKYLADLHGLTYWQRATSLRCKEQRLTRFNRDGIVCYGLEQCLSDARRLQHRRQLSPDEINEIDNFINYTQPQAECYPVFQQNRDKNLIYIIVESLNGLDVERSVGGQPLMPILRSLAYDDGTIFTTSMYSQVGDGISSDGHLMILSGLAPMQNGAYADRLGSVTSVPSIVGAMPDHSPWFVKGNRAEMWKSEEYINSLGFFNFYSAESIFTPRQEVSNRLDEKLFDASLKLINEAPKPMIFGIATISMHAPFKYGPDKVPDWIARDSDITDDKERRFLAAINYFDSCLGDFIDRLKSEGLYDDSVIIIVSDHSASATPHPGSLSSPVCFMALNTGLTRHITRTSGQIDIYPTVMQIMGLDSAPYFQGLGTSILNPQLDSAVLRDGTVAGDSTSPLVDRQQQATHISTLILEGNYFRRHLPQAASSPLTTDQ